MSIPSIPVFANIMGPQGIFILFVLLLLFGAKRLPEIGSSLGKGIREFKGSMREVTGEVTSAMEEHFPTHR